MLVKDLPYEEIPPLKMTDTVHEALTLMQDYHISNLAVTNEGQLMGIVNESELLELDDSLLIDKVRMPYLPVAIRGNDHIFRAISISALHGLSIIPVVDDDNQFKGIVLSKSLMLFISDFLQINEAGAMVVLEMEQRQYDLAQLCRIAESTDAQILQMNSRIDKQSARLEVTIRINKSEVSDIVATFQRYEYTVKYYFGEEMYANELKDNYENLMNYLNI